MDQRKISANYKKLYQKYGHDFRSLKWKTEKAATKRYEQIVFDLDFRNKTILDIGCGFGDMIPFIKTKADYFTYTGMDIVPEFIKKAKDAYPKYKFTVSDFTKDDLTLNYDIILVSGSLNSNRTNNFGFRRIIIRKLFARVNHALVFNMAGGFPQPPNSKNNSVWYADSLEILKYCLTLSSRIIFRSGYAVKDFTIVIYK